MRSTVTLATVYHRRFEVKNHEFTYQVPFCLIDLHELENGDIENRLFSYNKFNVLSLRSSDYLDAENTSLLTKLRHILSKNEVGLPTDRVVLITVPRLLNYAFNPVNFYYCFDSEGSWKGCVVEINNTFGEKHLYFLQQSDSQANQLARFLSSKDFHVSPFFTLEHDYHYLFRDVSSRLDITINLKKDQELTFHSNLKGTPTSFSTSETIKLLLRSPFSAALTMTRILYQAARLYYLKKVPVYRKPVPASTMTIKEATPQLVDRVGLGAFENLMKRLNSGRLTVHYPDQTTKVFSGSNDGLDATINIKEWYFFGQVLLRSDLGFAESFIDGEWESPDLAQLLSLLCDNKSALEFRSAWMRPISFGQHLIEVMTRRNSKDGARKNIHAHYDLGNEFFSTFLDPSMMYSCALYEKESTSLEDAQIAKLDRIIDRARIEADDHVLEIGTGWGGFAIRAATIKGCRVTTVTISEEQFKFATAKVKEAGLSDQITVLFCDYRDIEGQFDKIVSIEMLEAIGHTQIKTFFKVCDRVLKPNGLLFLQVITMPEQRYDQYRRYGDFIQRYIFPGAVVPSVDAIHRAATCPSNFVTESIENIGPHYAKTLSDWKDRFLDKQRELESLGFDQAFMRTWLYYLAYCQAGFARRVINNHHFVFSRSNNQTLIRQDLN